MPDYGLFIAGPLIYKTVGEIHLTIIIIIIIVVLEVQIYHIK